MDNFFFLIQAINYIREEQRVELEMQCAKEQGPNHQDNSALANIILPYYRCLWRIVPNKSITCTIHGRRKLIAIVKPRLVCHYVLAM